MSESVRDLLVRGTAAARSGDEKEAKFYLEWMLDLDADLEQKIEAWYWLSKVSSDIKQKRNYLEDILANQPFHLLARRDLMIIDGKLDPNEIIDPNQIPIQHLINGERKAEVLSYTCPNCGGRMVYTPDGNALTCEYCESRKMTREGRIGTVDSEQDFLLAMATTTGHNQPTESLSIECKACGIHFLLPPATLSFTCPHCNTSYVVDDSTVKHTITPGGIVPARVSRDSAYAILEEWVVENGLIATPGFLPLKGFYLPVWWFSFGGQVNYRYYINNDENRKKFQRELIQDCHPVLRDGIMVPAEIKFEQQLSWQIVETTSDKIIPFNPDYLSDWSAETYQISVADASLKARQMAFKVEKIDINNLLPANSTDVSFDSHELMVAAYKMVLLPAWIGEIHNSVGDMVFYINGENGKVFRFNSSQQNKPWWKLLFNQV
jgi:DNA-directed RNA polymerase subunit RPC12/RpoP